MTPRPEQTLLLRVCLLETGPAREAWAQWRSSTADPVRALGRRDGARRLLPLLLAAVERHGLAVEPALATYLRTASARDELRHATYTRILGEVLPALGMAGFSFVVAKGAALSADMYDPPWLRHSHDIDLLLGEADLPRAAATLEGLGWRPARYQMGSARLHRHLLHASGLPVALHANLFRLSFHRLALNDVWLGSRRRALAGAEARVLSAEDALLHVCGHAATTPGRRHLIWVCDAMLLLRNHPTLNWSQFLDAAIRSRMALSLPSALQYLGREMESPCPSHVLRLLQEKADEESPLAQDIGAFAAADGLPRKLATLPRMKTWTARGMVTRELLCPSSDYLRWAYRPRWPWLLPFLFVYHPLRFLARYVRQRWKARK